MVVAPPIAEVAEQADASVSKTDVRKDVRVRLPLSAPHPGIISVAPAVSINTCEAPRSAVRRYVAGAAVRRHSGTNGHIECH